MIFFETKRKNELCIGLCQLGLDRKKDSYYKSNYSPLLFEEDCNKDSYNIFIDQTLCRY